MTFHTDTVKRAHEEHLMAAFAVVLTHPAGFHIQLSDDLRIERRPDGQFAVQFTPVAEELFEDVRDAVSYYLDLRDELQMGLDYDHTPNGNDQSVESGD